MVVTSRGKNMECDRIYGRSAYEERKKERKNSAVVVVKRLEGNGNGIGTGTSPGRQNPESKQVGQEGI